MKCLVFSDSHGNPYYMQRAISLHKDAEVVFFLGDGLSDADAIAEKTKNVMWVAVRGNCDFHRLFLGRETVKVEEITLMGKRIVATHGDLYGAKYGLGGLLSLASERDSDIVLFGHTHTPHESYASENTKRPCYLFNPGSISSPHYSYGILTLTENTVLFSHGSF